MGRTVGLPDTEITGELNAALHEGDLNRIMGAMGQMARADGMGRVALDTGLGRESLYKSMRPGASPEFATVIKVLRALGLHLQVLPTPEPEPELELDMEPVNKKTTAANGGGEQQAMSEAKVNRNLALIGKTAFVTHYESLANFGLSDQAVARMIADDLGCAYANALTWRVRPARTLIRTNQGRTALQIISRSRRLPGYITERALELAASA